MNSDPDRILSNPDREKILLTCSSRLESITGNDRTSNKLRIDLHNYDRRWPKLSQYYEDNSKA